ncbi:MAG: GntR family transcriptional regulator [Candidatus Marinimicrobia bacterium]|nr:GntR family transcriptional regulator [Candidatus Neomarinimicrobiota bacterium]
MSQVGRMNTLHVMREVDFGIYLDGEELGDILLPKREVPAGTKVDDMLEVFVYFDSTDTIIASTIKPKTMVGEFASLKVIDNNEMGAFLDWGLPKDLLVPFREQSHNLLEGRHYVVYTYLDNASNRIAASTKLDKFLSDENPRFTPGEKVDLFIVNLTDLGFKAIIENGYWGLLFKDEVFQPLQQGQRLEGYIKNIREDGKIDLTLQEPGVQHMDAASQKILDLLKEHQGFLPFNDKTPPDIIYREFGLSKKVFKRSLGALYKKRLIKLEPRGIELLDDN